MLVHLDTTENEGLVPKMEREYCGGKSKGKKCVSPIGAWKQWHECRVERQEWKLSKKVQNRKSKFWLLGPDP